MCVLLKGVEIHHKIVVMVFFVFPQMQQGKFLNVFNYSLFRKKCSNRTYVRKHKGSDI